MIPAQILIVDDTPANLQLLAGLLRERGYKVRPVPSGPLALEAARAQPPDLILLDISMPGMDGYEVCRRLKQDDALCDIPVLFVSALNETTDKVAAFAAGGVDFVTKPFQIDEVAARVRIHLELRRREQQLSQGFLRLSQLEQQRDAFVHMVVHDMKSPLTGIGLSLELLRDMLPPEAAEMRDIADGALTSARQLTQMAEQMLLLSKAESGNLTPMLTDTDLPALASLVVQALRGGACGRRLELTGAGRLLCRCDAEMVRRVIQNLLSNALKFSPSGALVTVNIAEQAGDAVLSVTDQGPGIAPEHQAIIFEKYKQAPDGQNKLGTGLGLAYCRMAVDAHKGRISVKSERGKGSVFEVRLPLTC